jgi:hypothetical protein
MRGIDFVRVFFFFNKLDDHACSNYELGQHLSIIFSCNFHISRPIKYIGFMYHTLIYVWYMRIGSGVGHIKWAKASINY